MDAALQRELDDSFVYAMPKILFESIFWHLVKKIAKRKIYINVNFLDIFLKVKCVLCGLNMMQENLQEINILKQSVLQEHLKIDFSLKEVCLCVYIHANIKML